MENKILILSIIISIFFSCNNNGKIYKFETESTIKIPIEEERISSPPFENFDYCIIDKIETLIVYSENGKLVFYDISTKEIYHEIQLLKDRNLDAFEYINKDSILLLYGYPPNYDEIETAKKFDGFNLSDTLKFQLVDYNGNIRKYYHFNCNENNFVGTNYKIDQVLPPYTFLYYKTIKRVNNIVFFFPYGYGYYNFDTIENNAPLIAYYDLNTENFVFSKNLKLPYLKDKMYYPSNHDVINFCISANGLPLLRFFYSSDVFEWDYKNDKFIKYCLKSKLIDTIPPLTYPVNDINATNARYSSIYYDIDNELYYSSLYLSSDLYCKNYWSVIIADKNFNYINEVINPHNLFNPKFINKNIIYYNTIRKDTIIVEKIKLITENKNFEEYIILIRKDIDNQIKKRNEQLLKLTSGKTENPLLNFLMEKTNISDSNYCIVTIYAQDGCISCNEKILKIISNNSQIFSEVPLYLIVTGNENTIKEQLKYIDLSLLKNIILDNEAIVKRLPVKTSINNPRLTIVKNDVVVLDTIYDSFHIESDLIPTMLESLGLKQQNTNF